jgi:trans-L-3-hydroxyproline dehydratase
VITTLRAIDAHVGGEPIRVIVDGFPAPRGKTLLDKHEWAGRHADRVRRAMILEPRGHRDMCAAVLTEPALPGSHAGALFMHNAGFQALSGTAIVALATVALERGLLMPGGDGRTIVLDTAAGVVRAEAHLSTAAEGVRAARVSYVNVPSFVLAVGLPIKVGSRALRADIAYAGAFYAIVDSEAAGVGVSVGLAPELRRAGGEIRRAIEAARAIAHPLEPRLEGLDGIVFTAPPSSARADLSSVTVFADGAIDRSAGGNSTAAIMAVLSAMGLLADGSLLTHEGIVGSTFTGSIASKTMVGEYEAIVPVLEATAWITGEHLFLVDDEDGMRDGFLI